MLARNLSAATNDLICADLDCSSAALQEVVAWLNLCLPYSLPPVPKNQETFYQEAPWLSRAVMAWARVRNKLALIDRQAVDGWFIHQAETMYAWQQRYLAYQFPNRVHEDYTATSHFAQSGVMTSRALYADGPAIPSLAIVWNNRASTQNLFIGLVGIVFDAEYLREEAKRFVREWVAYSVWPDGCQGEYCRNGDYGIAGQGVIYGSTNIGCALTLAHELSKSGDNELFGYSTSSGLFGTAANGFPKTIWTAFDHHLRLLLGDKVLVNDLGAPIDAFAQNNQRAMHPTWYYGAAKKANREGALEKWLSMPSNFPGNDPYGPWHGVCGIYADARAA